MAKIKLTKNELKVQKDALKMYNRYLPTLMLKKQQLQTEIRTIDAKAKEELLARMNRYGRKITENNFKQALIPEGIPVFSVRR